MNKPCVFMFSGQGSQYYNMGLELFEKQPIFRKWMLRLDNITREIIGESVLEHLYDGSKGWNHQFDRTLFTHPAIFMVEYSLAQVFIENGIEPDYVAGASMGEFVSAAIAGVMKLEDILDVTVKQAEAFEAQCKNGGMIAVIDKPEIYYQNSILNRNSELASVNFDTHFVIAGYTEGLEKIEQFLKIQNIVYQKVPVTYGFHSYSIDSAASDYLTYLRGKTYQKPQIYFVSGLYAKLMDELPVDYFWNIARKPIRFSEAVRSMEEYNNYIYLDMGPGGTLGNFVRRNIKPDSSSEIYTIMTPFNRDLINVEKTLSALRGSTVPERRVVK